MRSNNVPPGIFLAQQTTDPPQTTARDRIRSWAFFLHCPDTWIVICPCQADSRAVRILFFDVAQNTNQVILRHPPPFIIFLRQRPFVWMKYPSLPFPFPLIYFSLKGRVGYAGIICVAHRPVSFHLAFNPDDRLDIRQHRTVHCESIPAPGFIASHLHHGLLRYRGSNQFERRLF